MLQLRIVLCLLLVAILAVSAMSVQPVEEKGLQPSLLDVDGQGHENAGERLARQGRGGGRGYGYRGGRDYYGGGRRYGSGRDYYGRGRRRYGRPYYK